MGVDFLRFAPTVPCRFFAGRPDIVVPMIWYPCAEDAPDLPIPTAFGSSNWDATAWPHDYPVGETRRPRASDYNGQGVRPLATGTHYCGTPEEFADGLVYDPDAVPPPRRDDGLLLCCGPTISARGGAMGGGRSVLIYPRGGAMGSGRTHPLASRGGSMGSGRTHPLASRGGSMCGGFWDMIPYGPPNPDAGGTDCAHATVVVPDYALTTTYTGPSDQWWTVTGTSGGFTKVEVDAIDASQTILVYTGSCGGLTLVATLTTGSRVVLIPPGFSGDVFFTTGATGTASTITITVTTF